MRPDKHGFGLAHHPDLLRYDFGPNHPLRPERISAGLSLLETCRLWEPAGESIVVSPAPVSELETVHDPAYMSAVDQAGSGTYPRRALAEHGLTGSDNPPFPDMHHASSVVVGATVAAARAVISGQLAHAFSPAGGLHHALRGRASGFCIYNDAAVASAILLREYGARVLYVDLDCHHGDGVQWIFYDAPEIFTLSFHESGRFLFPGTGGVEERGGGPGRDFCLNFPFVPFTRDDSWQRALHALLPAVTEGFRPDIILSNHGCDTHVWDPLTHLSLTTASFVEGAALVHRLAHEYCAGRWVAVGSGGYDWRRVVPRSWAILWAEMSGRPLPDSLPQSWRDRWLGEAEEPRPGQLLDDIAVSPPTPRQQEIVAANDETLAAVVNLLATG